MGQLPHIAYIDFNVDDASRMLILVGTLFFVSHLCYLAITLIEFSPL